MNNRYTLSYLLIISLILPTFTVIPSFEPSGNTTELFLKLLGTGVNIAASLTTIFINVQTYNHAAQSNEANLKKLNQEINGGYLNSISNSDTALVNNATHQKNTSPNIKKQLEENQKKIRDLAAFCRDGNGDKKAYDPTMPYKQEELNDTTEESANHTKNNTPIIPQKPGRVRRITNFTIKKTYDIADAIANTLPINSQLDQITQSEQLKNSWINTYKTEISRIAALGLIATSLAILYKSYSWYYNEERLTACEAVAQLEEQKEQIAIQFKEEIAKPTMSAQDKIKLQNAYDNYMQQLQEEINEQRAIAGYNIPKKLLIGSLIATSGIAGIVACARYYLSIKAANGTLGIPSVTEVNTFIQNSLDTKQQDPIIQSSNNNTLEQSKSTNNDTSTKTDVQPNTNANGTKINVEQPGNNGGNANNSNSDNEKELDAKSFPRPNFKGLV